MAAMKATGVWFGLLCFACLTSIGPTVLGLVHVPHQPLRYGDIIMARGLQGPGAHRMVKLRLRGGMNKDDDDSEEEAQKWQGAAGTVAAGTLASGNPLASEPNKEQESSAKGEEEGKDAVDAKKESEKGSDSESESEESVESEKEESEEEKAPVDPKFVREANRRMWEACVQGDEPGVDNAVQNGANVNAFCRGPGEWRNISVGEPQGADASYTGMNLAWFELNNYTAIHLATACGNPGIIEKVGSLFCCWIDCVMF